MPELFDHQKKLLELNPDKYLLAWGTGTGKTRTAIELVKKKNISALIICPKSLVENWKQEIVKWGGNNIDVISKENFKKKYKELPKYDCLVGDEAHYFGNYKSQLSKALYEYVNLFNPRYIYLLTATPYLSTPFNIYSLAKCLGKVWNWFKFKKHFFYEIKMGRRTIPVVRKNIEQDIAKLVNQLGSAVSLEQCFDVPEQIFQNEYFTLTTEQKKAIDGLLDVLPVTRFTRVHQICGGSLKGDGYQPTAYFKSEKLERLLELIAEHKLIAVVCRYNAEINHIYEKIKDKYPGSNIWRISGHINNRHEIVEAINKETSGVVLINGACSEGYGLPNIPIMCFYSYDFSLKNYIQMLGRIQRAGHIKKNIYLSLIVKDTIDEEIYKKVVIEKQDFHAEIYNKKI